MDLKAEGSKGTIENYLKGIDGLSHLKVSTKGALLTLTSEDKEGNIYPHARLRRRTVHKWSLEMPTKKSWEPTFMEGTNLELMNWLVEKFPWALAPR